MLETLSQIGELVGGLGALLALVYLAVQIRHNNAIAKAQSRQTLLDTWAVGNWDLARDSELLRAFTAGLSSWPDLSDEDKTKFDLGMSRFLTNVENGLLLRDAGLLDQEVLDQTADYMVVAIQSPGGSRWWRDTALAKPAVREYIDGRLSAGDAHLPAIQDAMPHFVPTSKADSSVPK